MNQKKLNKIVEKHKKWILKEEDGEQANLHNADLRGADLHNVDLRGADLRGANLRDADLHGANLYSVDLYCADLRGADLCGANLDFSCMPLWCGSLYAHFDDKQLKQIVYHIIKAGLQSKNTSEETKTELKKLIDFANQFHRVKECGKIIVKKTIDK